MLQKLTTTHIILIAAGVVIVGFFIGSMLGKQVETNSNPKLGKVSANCPTSNGVPCCAPRRWRFNSGSNENECV